MSDVATVLVVRLPPSASPSPLNCLVLPLDLYRTFPVRGPPLTVKFFSKSVSDQLLLFGFYYA